MSNVDVGRGDSLGSLRRTLEETQVRPRRPRKNGLLTPALLGLFLAVVFACSPTDDASCAGFAAGAPGDGGASGDGGDGGSSGDAGSTWTTDYDGSYPVAMVAAARDTEGTRMYMATRSSGVLLSLDSARTWTTDGLEQTGLAALAVNPAKSLDVSVIQDRTVLRSFDGGDTWLSKSTGLSFTGNPSLIVHDPSTPKTMFVYGTWPDDGYKTTNAGETWEKWSPGFADVALGSFGTLVIDPEDSAHMFAWFSQSGLLESADAGESWEARSTGLPETNATVLQFSKTGDGLYLGTCQGLFYAATADLTQWEALGLATMTGECVVGLVTHGTDPILYALTSISGQTMSGTVSYGTLYRSLDSGETWEAAQRR
jgi:photosystem II stability/assembly factor-like uncharacterized protein